MRSVSRGGSRRVTGLRWTLSVCLIIGLWALVTWLADIHPTLLPSPVDTMRALIADASFLASHAATTAIETLGGFVLAIAGGLLVGILMNASFLARDLLYPPLILSQAVPLIAVAPLILIWFGYGPLAKTLIVAFVCFFPIAVNTYEGFRTVDPAMRELLDTFGASRADRYRHLYIPATLPGIVAGAKIAATYSVLGAVIGEWLGGSKGMGVYMQRALQSFRADRLFAAILIVMTMSLVVFQLVAAAGWLLLPWRRRRNRA